jgi:lipopolysaccharide export LptBFGC system permease protein LptF
MGWKRLWLGTLDRYVLRRFLAIYAANLFSFTLIFILVDSLSHFERFLDVEGGIWRILAACARYYAAITPVIFCQVLGPVISVSAALFVVTVFHRNNEFTPILATGRSLQRSCLPILVASLFLSAGSFALQELWIPRTVGAIRDAVQKVEASSVLKNVKHYDTQHGNLIAFREYDRHRRTASGVVVLPVLAQEGHEFLIHAREAQWIEPETPVQGSVKGYWLLRDGLVQEYDEKHELVLRKQPPGWKGGGAQRLYGLLAEWKLQSNLIPQDIGTNAEETVQMSLGDLWRKAETAPDQSVWIIKYFARFSYAATNFLLVLLGIPVIAHFTNRNILFGALIAVAVSTSYFVVNSVTQDFGVQGHLSARVAAVLAPCLFLALGTTLYRNMRS